MPNILDSENFGLKIYNKFPYKYREDDATQNYALKNYLQSLSDGGFKQIIDGINDIPYLIDPYKVDAKVLPILFKQYGLELFNGIPEGYLRYLLPRLGEAWSKKGSLSVLEYIASSISGVQTETEISYWDEETKTDYTDNPQIKLKLLMDKSLENNYVPGALQFGRLLENFIPFYCDLNLVYNYLYSEPELGYPQSITLKDLYNSMTIKNTISEVGAFSSENVAVLEPMTNRGNILLNSTFILNKESHSVPEYHKDIIKYFMMDTGKINPIISEHNNIFIKMSDTHTLGSKELFRDNLSQMYEGQVDGYWRVEPPNVLSGSDITTYSFVFHRTCDIVYDEFVDLNSEPIVKTTPRLFSTSIGCSVPIKDEILDFWFSSIKGTLTQNVPKAIITWEFNGKSYSFDNTEGKGSSFITSIKSNDSKGNIDVSVPMAESYEFVGWTLTDNPYGGGGDVQLKSFYPNFRQKRTNSINLEPHQRKIVFKVVNGTWADGTTSDLEFIVDLKDEQGNNSENGTVNIGDIIPTGMIPFVDFTETPIKGYDVESLISISMKESGKIIEQESSLLNSPFTKLVGSFFTNTYGNYDTVTYMGVSEIFFN